MGIGKWIKQQSEKAAEEIETKVNEKLDEEVLDPTLREHKGEPLKKPGDK